MRRSVNLALSLVVATLLIPVCVAEGKLWSTGEGNDGEGAPYDGFEYDSLWALVREAAGYGNTPTAAGAKIAGNEKEGDRLSPPAAVTGEDLANADNGDQLTTQDTMDDDVKVSKDKASDLNSQEEPVGVEETGTAEEASVQNQIDSEIAAVEEEVAEIAQVEEAEIAEETAAEDQKTVADTKEEADDDKETTANTDEIAADGDQKAAGGDETAAGGEETAAGGDETAADAEGEAAGMEGKLTKDSGNKENPKKAADAELAPDQNGGLKATSSFDKNVKSSARGEPVNARGMETCSFANIQRIKQDMKTAAKLRADCAKRAYVAAAGKQAKSMCERVIVQLRAAQNTVRKIRGQNSSLKSKASELTIKLNSLVLKKKSLATRAAKVALSLGEEKKKSAVLENKLAKLRGQLVLSKRAIGKLRKEIATRENTILRLKRQRSNLQKTIQTLKKTSAHLRSKIAAREDNEVCGTCTENRNCGSDGRCISGKCFTMKSRGQSCTSKCSKCQGGMTCKKHPVRGKICCGGSRAQ